MSVRLRRRPPWLPEPWPQGIAASSPGRDHQEPGQRNRWCKPVRCRLNGDSTPPSQLQRTLDAATSRQQYPGAEEPEWFVAVQAGLRRRGSIGRWFSRPLPDSREMAVPASFNDIAADATVRDYFGDVWYQTSVWVPQGWQGRRIVLQLRVGHPPGHGLGQRCRGGVARGRVHPVRSRHHRPCHCRAAGAHHGVGQ